MNKQHLAVSPVLATPAVNKTNKENMLVRTNRIFYRSFFISDYLNILNIFIFLNIYI